MTHILAMVWHSIQVHLNDPTPQHSIPDTSPSIGLGGEPETTKEFVANQLELQYTTRTPRLAFSSPPLALGSVDNKRVCCEET